MTNEPIRRIILDVDPGLDDAFAILLFLYAEKLEKLKIDAIIVSRGNTTLQNACKNTVRLLETVKRTDIPVYMGAREGLIVSEAQTLGTHYGADGFGDLIFDTEPDLSIVKNYPGAAAMHDLVVEHPDEISLVCLAPLTNVALAHKIYDDFISNVKDIFIMGGNNTGVGNATSAAEYNFYLDPEAVQIVLNGAKCPITILPYEPCIALKLDYVTFFVFDFKDEEKMIERRLQAWRFDVLGKIDTPQMKLLNQAEEKIQAKRTIRRNIWYPCDAFLAASIVDPVIIVTKTKFNATVELNGNLTRGQLVLDHLRKKEPNVTIIESINKERLMDVMLTAAVNY